MMKRRKGNVLCRGERSREGEYGIGSKGKKKRE